MLVQGVQAIAKAAPASDRPAASGQAQQLLGVPLAVEQPHEWRRQEHHPQQDDHDAADLLELVLCGRSSVEPITVALSPSRMKIVEKLAMNSRLGTSTRRAPTPSLRSAGVTPITVER